ncbi:MULTISPECIES: hypothetical protein [Caulobacter]|jgi:hypothetical protein|uniref:UrcA family protein n=1 Tax=Caulobacter rhizosphaerae TaxID=2010972 RepID=A0ABU1MUF2_9CAUL|nr:MULTISPECIES: hypothetical protein [Caulobacter]KQZ27390.1 hypothetical protein ASD47_06750 [Caulobacter sp. Root1472]MDR6529810.1 hypothetical protein [Caulobacter rhizosphaerae]GGL29843.1 hypothetical protein GCM10010983_28920 [Caulobacter rhizosphaerae]
MKTLFVLAASAIALTSVSSAFAGEQHVKVRGRTVAAIHADIVAAASSICREEIGQHPNDLYSDCVREVTRDAVQKVGSPTLKAYDRQAFRTSGLLKVSY